MKNLIQSKLFAILACILLGQSVLVSAAPNLALEAKPVDVVPIDPTIIFPPLLPFDAKTFHGSECQPYYGSQAGDLNYYSNRIYNAGSQGRWVTCPVVRDNTTNTNGTFGTEIYVHNVAGQTLSCTLYSYDTHGSWLASDYKATTSGGKQTLRPDVNLSKNMGNYSLSCYLPKGASLYGYKVKEWLTNNNSRTDWFN